MRTRIALFTFTIISAAAIGLFVSAPICAEPSTETQPGLLPTSASYAVVFAARHDGGGRMGGGDAWHGGKRWPGRDGWHRPYRGFYGGGYIGSDYMAPYYGEPYDVAPYYSEPDYVAPYYGERYYVVPDCDKAVVDPYSGGWVCSSELYQY
jgi:hypothetical protein